MHIQFQTPYQFLFIHQNVKHLLVIWEKEHKKEIYIVDQESSEHLLLQYPGEAYREHVLDEVEAIFFPQIQLEDKEIPVILAATFQRNDHLYAVYYPKDRIRDELYFLQVKEQDQQLVEIPEDEYLSIVEYFQELYPEYF